MCIRVVLVLSRPASSAVPEQSILLCRRALSNSICSGGMESKVIGKAGNGQVTMIDGRVSGNAAPSTVLQYASAVLLLKLT